MADVKHTVEQRLCRSEQADPLLFIGRPVTDPEGRQIGTVVHAWVEDGFVVGALEFDDARDAGYLSSHALTGVSVHGSQ